MLGLIFVFASIEKIVNPGYFAAVIQNYQIIPDALVNLIAIFLPWLELTCALLLILGLWYRSAATILAFLLVAFIIILLSAIIRGLNIECGCFGSGASVGWGRIIEDIFLLGFSLYIVFFPSNKLALQKY
jgi:uncharacterized membrane protein YphA (DoxX/SURF4 family)